jgi:nucleoside permease NupC
MTDVTKSKIAGYVQILGFILAAPFLAIGASIVIPMILLGDQIHSCTYDNKEHYDPQSGEHYKLCTTCGDKIICGEMD